MKPSPHIAPSEGRTLPDGCATCGMSLNYCDCVKWIGEAGCCSGCTHRHD